jgi:hypothetical protein
MMNWKLGLAGVALAALAVSCGGGDGGTPATVDSFKAKAQESNEQPKDNLELPPQGGDVTLSWSVSGADSVTISDNNSAIADIGTVAASGSKNVDDILKTTVFTITAKKSGAKDATKALTVTVQEGQRVSGKVLKFNGEAAFGVRVQIGDASTQNNLQTQTASDGSFTLEGAPSPYTISAVPTTSIESTISFKNVTSPNPTLVLEPRTGIAGTCPNAAEAYIRFRLPGASTVETSAVDPGLGYVYFIPNGTKKTALHEDTLKSNAIQVLSPGQRTGYVRVRFSQNSCANEVTGSLVYLERKNGGYTFSGKLDGVIARSGATTPSSGDTAYEIPTSNNGSRVISGKVLLPGGYNSGFAFMVIEIGGGAVIVSDPRDIKAITTSEQGRTFAFQLPKDLGSNIKYRVGVYAAGPNHDSWFFSNNLHPLPESGATNLEFATPNEFTAQQPSGVRSTNTPDAVSVDFDWPETTNANLYYLSWAKTLPLSNNCTTNDYFWTAVSADPTNAVERTRFRLPILPEPARLEAGTDAKPCDYNWAADNGVTVRKDGSEDAETALTSDKMLDGRLVLKRHYIRATSGLSFVLNFLHIVPVWVRNTNAPSEAELLFRDEMMWFWDQIARPSGSPTNTVLDLINSGTLEATIPSSLDLSGYNGSSPDAQFLTTFAPDITVTERSVVNRVYSSEFVGPFNNPIEIKQGVVSRIGQNFKIKLAN